MTWYAIDWILLVAALWFGRPPVLVVVALTADLALGGTGLAQSPYAIAIVDLGAAIVCLGHSARGDIAALIFVAMTMTGAVMTAMDFSRETTYACIDALLWVQLGVIGGIDRGIRHTLRHTSRRRNSALGHVEVRPASVGLSGTASENRRGLM